MKNNIKQIAIIADGNRRWAKKNNLPIDMGYAQGLITIEKCCKWALLNKIPYLTFYCFSTENWKRPENEINTLMKLAQQYFESSFEWYKNLNIKVCFAGRRDRLSKEFLKTMQYIESQTQNCKSLILNICVDYGGRDEIIRALSSGNIKTEKDLSEHLDIICPDPDIILRPGGEKRLSYFFIWLSAYAVLFFEDFLFPEIDENKMNNIIKNFNKRKRNFGG